MATATVDSASPADGEGGAAAAAVSTEPALLEAAPAPPPKVRLMCSAGGRILPRPTDGALCYLGGETRIVVFDRVISIAGLRVRIGRTFSLHPQSFFMKYQLPFEDLDSLVSVCNEEDLENLIDEYFRLPSAAAAHADAKPCRIRLFLFPLAPKPIVLDPARPETWFVDALNDDWSARSAAAAVASRVQDMLSLDGQDVQSISSSPMQEAAASRSSSLESMHSIYLMLSLPPIRVRADGELDLDPPPPPAPTYLLCNSSADAAVRPICKEGVAASTVNEVETNPGGNALESNPNSISDQLLYPGHQQQFILPGEQQAPVYYHIPTPLLQQQQLQALQMPMYLMQPPQQQQLDNVCVNPKPMQDSKVYSTSQLPDPTPVIHDAASAGIHPKLQQASTTAFHNAASSGIHPMLQQSAPAPVIDNGAPILQQSAPTLVIHNAASAGVHHTMQQEALTPAIQNLVTAGLHPAFHLAAPITVIDNPASAGGHSMLQQVAPTPVTHNAASAEVHPRLQQAAPTPVTYNAASAEVQPTLQQAVPTPGIHNAVSQGFPYSHLTYMPPQLMPEIASFTYVPISEATFQAYPMPVVLQPQYGMSGAPPSVHHPENHQQQNADLNRE